jgi:nucleoside-triphosphatase
VGLKTRIWLLTGEPSVGKSTAVSKILLSIRTAGYLPGGVVTREIRSHGERLGFSIVDISSEKSDILADVKGIIGPRLGKYRVNLKALSTIGVDALASAISRSDVMVVDEIGPMELMSPEFRKAIHLTVLETPKPALCAVHKRFQDPLIDEIRKSPESLEQEITFENRDELPAIVAKDIIQYLESRR